MQKRRMMWQVLVVLVMATFVIWLGACASTPEPSAPVMEETVDGAAMLEQSCTKCHTLERVMAKQWTSEEWGKNVDAMIGKGAEVSDKAALVAYLAETYGP